MILSLMIKSTDQKKKFNDKIHRCVKCHFFTSVLNANDEVLIPNLPDLIVNILIKFASNGTTKANIFPHSERQIL